MKTAGEAGPHINEPVFKKSGDFIQAGFPGSLKRSKHSRNTELAFLQGSCQNGVLHIRFRWPQSPPLQVL